MKILYAVTITGNQHESRERATDTAPTYCCDEMYNAWGGGDIAIGFDPERKVVDLEGYDSYDGEIAFRGGEGLRYCPWCGETIELERAGTEDKRTTACAAELKNTSVWLEAQGRKAYCPNSPLSGRTYCGRHKHLEEGAVAEELFGIPVVYDERLDPDEGAFLSIERTCKCDPATLVRIVISPVTGVQCACGAVWPLAKEPEEK